PSETGRSDSSSASPLDQYPHEGMSRHHLETPTSSRSVQAARPERPVAASPRTAGRRTKLPDDADVRARLVTGTASTVAVEQYRRLGAVLHDEQIQRKLKTVIVTSALPQDGKTLTIVNLALTLSESYERRVLLIDADVRCPGVHTILDLPNDQGLSDVLLDG